MKYTVKRQHYADRAYSVGDTLSAAPSDVAHLVEAGVLKAVQPERNKAAPPVQNKARRAPRRTKDDDA